MRKTWLIAAIAAITALAVAAVAFAQSRTNTYTVSGSVTPAKKGTSKKPVPVGVKFSYTVENEQGVRPAPVKRYTISLAGVKANTSKFPKCTAATINANESISDCPKGSRVGTGKIDAVAGPESDTSNQSIKCPLNLQVYNGGGSNKAAIYIVGGANAPAGFKTSCPTDTNAAIDAKFVKQAGGSALQFDVPQVPFRQQLGTVEVTVVRVQSTISKMVRKGRGFFESTGGCKGGKRAIKVTFLNEDNQTGTASTTTKCS